MDLISAKGYENAGVNLLKIEGTDEFRVSMKDVGVGLGVKSISDLVLKEIQGIYEKKINKRRKWLKENFVNWKMNWIQRVIKMFLWKIISWQILLSIAEVKEKRTKGNRRI